jgi:fructokinase
MHPPLVVGLGELLWDLLPAGRQVGGAPANFAFHAARLGARAEVVSAVGDDALGAELRAALQARGLSTHHIAVDPDHPTSTVSVVLDSAGVPAFTIHEQVAWDWLTSSPALDDLARATDVVCFGTLAQRAPTTRATVARFLDQTRAECLRVCDVNLRQRFWSTDLLGACLARADVLKLNDEELPRVAEALGIADSDPLCALRERYGLRLVALTRGVAGCVLLANERVEHAGCAAPVLVDTVGAGDAFTAALALGLLAGQPLDELASAANELAAWVCSQPGAMPA